MLLLSACNAYILFYIKVIFLNKAILVVDVALIYNRILMCIKSLITELSSSVMRLYFSYLHFANQTLKLALTSKFLFIIVLQNNNSTRYCSNYCSDQLIISTLLLDRLSHLKILPLYVLVLHRRLHMHKSDLQFH